MLRPTTRTYTYTNFIPMSISGGFSRQLSKFTKSSHVSRSRRDVAYTHNTHAYSLLWTHVHKPYLYEYLRRTELVDIKIHEVTTCVSRSTGTLPTTESIALLNHRINPKKIRAPMPRGLESNWAGSTQGSQPIDLWSVRKIT
jgi:hypothetical protein